MVVRDGSDREGSAQRGTVVKGGGAQIVSQCFVVLSLRLALLHVVKTETLTVSYFTVNFRI